MSRLWAVGFIAVTFCAVSAEAKVVYCGVGNEDFANDVNVLRAKLLPCLGPGDVADVDFNLGGQEICDKLVAAAAMCLPGDIFIFHYSGHGNLVADDDPNEDPFGDDGVIGLFQGTADPNDDDVIRDDDLALKFKDFPECCTVLVIIDACFGAEFWSGAEDLGRPNIDIKDSLSALASADKCNKAPGQSLLLAKLCQALESNGSTVVGDANLDGKVTMTEFFNHAAACVPDVESYYDWDTEHDRAVLWERAGPGPGIPAVDARGAALIVVGLGIGAILLARRHPRQASEPR